MKLQQSELIEEVMFDRIEDAIEEFNESVKKYLESIEGDELENVLSTNAGCRKESKKGNRLAIKVERNRQRLATILEMYSIVNQSFKSLVCDVTEIHESLYGTVNYSTIRNSFYHEKEAIKHIILQKYYKK